MNQDKVTKLQQNIDKMYCILNYTRIKPRSRPKKKKITHPDFSAAKMGGGRKLREQIQYVPLLMFFLMHLPKHQLYCCCRCIMQYLLDWYKCVACHSAELQSSHLLPKTLNITVHRINNCACFYWL